MKIIVDAFGGDNAPLEILKGCAFAVVEHDVDILLVGDKKKIEKVANDNRILLRRIEIKDVHDVISMEDEPTSILNEKSQSSMAEGLKALVAGEGDAFVSAGNSGALAVGATLIAKRIRGIKRAAFAPILPNSSGHFMLIDSGANVECRPEMLKQFGIMGHAYMKNVLGVPSPRVGLANIGAEKHKGTELYREAYNLLEKSSLNFVGNVEARDIPADGADVVVADGFTGNIILKTYEGVAMELFRKIKGILFKNLKTKLAALMIQSDLMELKKSADYNEFGGAPILGISKPVFKVHGNAKAKAVKSAIGLVKKYVEGNVIEEIYSVVKRSNLHEEEKGSDVDE